MPTGYTQEVKDGTVTEFNEFIAICAKAMGAFYHLRDEVPTNELPEKMPELSTEYEEKGIENAKAKIAKLNSMTEEEIEAEAEAQFQHDLEYWLEYRMQVETEKARYESMLDKVRQWNPPTEDHVQLKGFMEDQLTKSVDFDCYSLNFSPPAKKSSQEWFDDNMENAEWNLNYFTKNLETTKEKNKSRQKWVDDLRNSLK